MLSYQSLLLSTIVLNDKTFEGEYFHDFYRFLLTAMFTTKNFCFAIRTLGSGQITKISPSNVLSYAVQYHTLTVSLHNDNDTIHYIIIMYLRHPYYPLQHL